MNVWFGKSSVCTSYTLGEVYHLGRGYRTVLINVAFNHEVCLKWHRSHFSLPERRRVATPAAFFNVTLGLRDMIKFVRIQDV